MGGCRPNYNQEGPRLFQLLGADNDDDDNEEAEHGDESNNRIINNEE